jgi:hypothetical protein
LPDRLNLHGGTGELPWPRETEVNMKTRYILLCALIILTGAAAETARGQSADKFVRKTFRQYWRDLNNQPWSDLSYQMAVRIDPQYAQNLNSQEISDEDPVNPLRYPVGGEPHLFSLKRDAVGTYADFDCLVYDNKTDPITYQVELQKGGRSASFISGASSRIDLSNDTPNLPTIGLKENNPLFLKDWLVIAGAILGGAILIYILIFRALFSGLLFKRRWGVSSAEHFTWSMSLLAMLALASALTLFYLGPRLETWVIIGVMGAFWLLHSVVWLVSGKEA